MLTDLLNLSDSPLNLDYLPLTISAFLSNLFFSEGVGFKNTVCFDEFLGEFVIKCEWFSSLEFFYKFLEVENEDSSCFNSEMTEGNFCGYLSQALSGLILMYFENLSLSCLDSMITSPSDSLLLWLREDSWALESLLAREFSSESNVLSRIFPLFLTNSSLLLRLDFKELLFMFEFCDSVTLSATVVAS